MKPALLSCFTMLLVLSGFAHAGEPVRAVDITGIESGTYLLEVEGSRATISPLQLLKPDTPQPPGPDELTERGKKVKAAAIAVTGDPNRERTAQTLAELYRQIAAQIASGRVTDAQVAAQMVKRATDALLPTSAVEPWQPVRDLITEQWADVLQRGGSVGDCGTLLEEIAAGLEASSDRMSSLDAQECAIVQAAITASNPNATSDELVDALSKIKLMAADPDGIDPVWIELIMQIVKMIIEMLINSPYQPLN